LPAGGARRYGRPPPMGRAYALALVGLVGLSSAALAGCAPNIGSRCVINTDCGASGALVCDTSQPYGYCTQFNCTPNSCHNQAVCVEFLASVPGCPYDDYRSPSRTGRTFCMEHCTHDSDCRQGDGYRCLDPRKAPWYGAITDDNQSQLVCIIPPDTPIAEVNMSLPEGSVCSASGPAVPPIDAGEPLLDAAGDAARDGAAADAGGGDAGADAAIDGGLDSGTDAGDGAGLDAEIDSAPGDGAADGGEADAGGADSPSDGAPDAGAADGQGGS
jgi:hypothetical protein